MRSAPFPIELKPYGRALLDLAQARDDVLCLSGDLTKQCEVDLFRDAIPDRFIHAGMAEANMVGIGAALARDGFVPFLHTFGVFATRRPFDQIVNAVGHGAVPVRIVGFMPGISSPGGPSHQAIDDVALMRVIPNMTVIDVPDAVTAIQVPSAVVDLDGPVYVRCKRGEIPVVLDDDYQLRIGHADVLASGGEVALIASGMMLATVVEAASILSNAGVSVTVINVTTIKPFDAPTVLGALTGATAVISVENHSIIGGLGSAVAEALAEAGAGVRLTRLGVPDTYAEAALSAAHLFDRYKLSVSAVVEAAWLTVRSGEVPHVPIRPAAPGEYAPV